MKKPFSIVPWQDDFLAALLDLAREETGDRLAKALFVFPHLRPARYLEQLIRQSTDLPKPCLMPRIVTGGALFAEICASRSGPAASEPGLLDRVGLLLDCLRAEQRQKAASGQPMFRPGQLDDAGFFLPWGLRLADLLEECFIHNRRPENYQYVEDLVSPFAAALLGNLANLHRAYAGALAERGWSTPGFTAFRAAGILRERGEALDMFEGRAVFIAGFHSLSGTEKLLFRRLWDECGATICLHADPELVTGAAPPHWSCRELAHWARSWRAGLELRRAPGASGEPSNGGPILRFHQGYDLHSQLAALGEMLDQDGAPMRENAESGLSGTAVVLPDTGLLLPVLHHLPRTDLNVSMGYPLARSPLSRLLETVLCLQERRRDKLYYWRDLVRLIRHPYLSMLRPDPAGEAGTEAPANDAALKTALHSLEQALRRGQAFADPFRLLAGLPAMAPETEALLNAILQNTLNAWENPANLKELGLALEKLCGLLIRRGPDLWPRFPIDAECLARIRDSVIPELANCALRDEPLDSRTLFAMLRGLLAEERAPFEAYPLVGLQVMGLLETRLLSFKRVFILEATEDLLPGGTGRDALLPDVLRRSLGLPDAGRRRRLSAYHFFRLLAASDQVDIFWQEGVESGGLQEAKKTRSRFAEELIWQEELKAGRLLSPAGAKRVRDPDLFPAGSLADGPLRVLPCRIRPLNIAPGRILVSPQIKKSLDAFLQKPVSASAMDAYLSCPLRFFYERLAGLAPAEEVAEGEDPQALGNLLHAALQEFYAPRRGLDFEPGPGDFLELRNIFLRRLAENPLAAQLGPDSLAMLRITGPERLKTFLDNQAQTRVEMLEAQFSAGLTVNCGERILTPRLYGVLDRLDFRAGRGLILDYKSGRVPEIDSKIWQDEPFWDSLAACPPADAQAGAELWPAIRLALPSVQLPFYLYLARHGLAKDSSGENRRFSPAPQNAAWVELKMSGREIPVLPPDLPDEEAAGILDERIPLLLRFILGQLAGAKTFLPQKSPKCLWCNCKGMCIIKAA